MKYNVIHRDRKRFSGFLWGIYLALADILGTKDLFQATGKGLCDVWLKVDARNCIMVFPPYLYTEFKSSYKDLNMIK